MGQERFMIRRHSPLLSLLVVAGAGVLPATAAPLNADDPGRLRISQRPCRLNDMKQTCVITTAGGSQAMRIVCSGGGAMAT
jgi:hypothetical protein